MNKTDILAQAFKTAVKEFENYNNNLVNKSLLIMIKMTIKTKQENTEADFILKQKTKNFLYRILKLRIEIQC